MVETSREALAKAEFWSTDAMARHDVTAEQRELLRKAGDLIRRAAELEELKAQQRALKAAQLA